MNPEPLTPLVKQEDDPFEHALLRAGQRERAPRGSDRRLLAALGVGGGGALAAVVTSYTSKVGGKGVLATVAVSIAAIVAGSWAISPSHDAPEPTTMNVGPPAEVAPSAPAPATDGKVETLPSTRVEDLPSSSQPAPRPAGKVGSPIPATTAAASAAVSADDAPSLAREVALIQGARAALARGEANEALRTLDVHDREFPNGTLRPESRVLRIETLVRAGGEQNVARANVLGDAFLAEHRSGPQARRVRAVLGRVQ